MHEAEALRRGKHPKSLAALSNLKKICAGLDGQFRIDVIDLMKNPKLAQGDQILAIPTLVRSLAGSDPEDHWRPFGHGTGSGWVWSIRRGSEPDLRRKAQGADKE